MGAFAAFRIAVSCSESEGTEKRCFSVNPPTFAIGGDLPRHLLKAFKLWAKTAKAQICAFGTFVAMDKSTYKHEKLSI